MPKYSAAQKRAYAKRNRKKAAQKKFALRRPRSSVVRSIAPILETKKFCGWYDDAPATITTHTMSTASASLTIVPDSFCFMQSAVDTTSPVYIEGYSVFSKYLSLKIEVVYPDGANMPLEPVLPMEIIWGWVNPLNLTPFTTPTEGGVDRADIVAHAVNTVSEEFNSETDTMLFGDKKRRLYNVIGRKKILPNLSKQVPMNVYNTGMASGPIQKTISWPMNKKVEYIASDDDEGDEKLFMYPNQAYIPFVTVFNPSFAAYAPGSPPTDVLPPVIRYNSCHWFNDA